MSLWRNAKSIRLMELLVPVLNRRSDRVFSTERRLMCIRSAISDDKSPSAINLSTSSSRFEMVTGDGATLLKAIGKLIASVRDGGDVMDMTRNKRDNGDECFVLTGSGQKQIECENLTSATLQDDEVALLLSKRGTK